MNRYLPARADAFQRLARAYFRLAIVGWSIAAMLAIALAVVVRHAH